MEKERRKRERFKIDQVIELSTSNGPIINVSGVNISESGLLCRSDIEIPSGTYVIFQLLMPGGKASATVSCEGTILKCSEINGKYNVVIDFTG